LTLARKKKNKIQILDYGSGNLYSIREAISRASQEVEPVVDSSFDESACALVLPGVGSFSSAQSILGQNRQSILDAVLGRGVALLGICLGMQLLFEGSDEGRGEGLGLFKGHVRRFSPNGGAKVPHMGWNEAMFPSTRRSLIAQGTSRAEWAYYVHSFYPTPEEEGIVEAWTEYAGVRFPALVSRGKIFGTQFHPEKSHIFGARIITNFVNLALGQRQDGDGST